MNGIAQFQVWIEVCISSPGNVFAQKLAIIEFRLIYQVLMSSLEPVEIRFHQV